MSKVLYTALTLLFLTASTEVRAQTVGKVEVGAQFTSLTLPVPPSDYNHYTEPGFGARLTYNLNDNIAVEGEANFFLNKNVFVFDAGGVNELYVSRRIMTRMDFGDTIIKYGERVVPGFSLSQNIVRRPPETRHNFQFTAGLGFRF